jgi:DNA-binding SARP family transcriptional activator
MCEGVQVRYGILGPVEVRAGDEPSYVGGPRERRTLAALLLNANRQVSAERLSDLLWDERPPPTATAQIRNTIAALRRQLAVMTGSQSPIERAAGGYVIRVDDDQLDATVFDAQVRQGRSLAAQGRLGDAVEALRVALELWRGPALDGVPGRVFEAEAAGLEERRLVCLEQRVEWDLALGRHRELVGEVATLVGAYPLRERLVEAQMMCLYRVGRRADALDAFMAARTRFAEQAGLDPGARLVRLQKAILCGDPSLDLLVADDRDDVSPPAPRRPTPAQLPADVPAFTGRAAQLKDLDGLLPDSYSGTAGVVAAITGTAGVGKTALAVHWAHRVRHRFGDGQLYVNLRGFDPAGSAVTAEEALPAFLDALGVPPDRLPVGLDAQVGSLSQSAGGPADAGDVGQRCRRRSGPTAAAWRARLCGRGDEPPRAARTGGLGMRSSRRA